MLSKKDIEASLYYYINQNYAGVVTHGNPEDLDPDADSIDEWLMLFITENRSRPGRASCDDGEIILQVEAHNRARTNLHASASLADGLIEVLAEKTIAIHDYDESDEPVVGHLELREADITKQPVTGDVWDSVIITIPGRYQERV